MPDKDIVKDAWELLSTITSGLWVASGNGVHKGISAVATTHAADRSQRCADAEFIARAPELLRALANEVEHARRALRGMVELWDANNPDDPCGCVGASDDCKYPPPCELCVARLVAEGRTKELIEG